MRFTVAIGAQEVALFEFRLDLLKGRRTSVAEAKILLGRIPVMEFKRTLTAVISAIPAAATLVRDRLRFELPLARHRLLDGATLAVYIHTIATSSPIKCVNGEFALAHWADSCHDRNGIPAADASLQQLEPMFHIAGRRCGGMVGTYVVGEVHSTYDGLSTCAHHACPVDRRGKRDGIDSGLLTGC